MANILLDGANWYDDNYGMPPSYWTGTEYEYIGSGGDGPTYYYGATMQYQGTVNDGDVVAGSITSTSADATEFGITVNGTAVAAESLTNGQTYPFSFALNAGDAVVVTLGVGNYLYSQDAILTPSSNPSPPAPPPDCGELGRVTRAFVSGYTAARNESRRIRRFSKRCCVADFNGAMPLGCTITHARFDTTSPWSLLMSNPRVESTGRRIAVDVKFNFAGFAALKATATWSNQEVTNVEFHFQVLDTPLYPDAFYNNSNGPYSVQVDA